MWVTLEHRPLWKTHYKLTKEEPQTLLHKAGQVSMDEVKLIRAGQTVTVEGREQRQEM